MTTSHRRGFWINGFPLFRLPTDVIACILREWICNIQDILRLDVAIGHRDQRKIFIHALQGFNLQNVLLPEHPKVAERCFQWLMSRRVSMQCLKQCDINILTQFFRILVPTDFDPENHFSSILSLNSMELIGRCQPYREEDAMTVLASIQKLCSLQHIKTSILPYSTSTASSTSYSLFSPKSKAKEDKSSFHASYLPIILHPVDNKPSLQSLEISLNSHHHRILFKEFLPLHSQSLRSLVLLDVFLYDREVLSILRQVPSLECFHMFRSENMPLGGSLPPIDSWSRLNSSADKNFAIKDEQEEWTSFILWNLQELHLGPTQSESSFASSPLSSSSSSTSSTANLLSAYLIFYAPHLQRLTLKGHFVTVAAYQQLFCSDFQSQSSLKHLSLQGCVDLPRLSTTTDDTVDINLACTFQSHFPHLESFDIGDGGADVLVSIFQTVMTYARKPYDRASISERTGENLYEENIADKNTISHGSLQKLYLSVSPTLRAFRPSSLFSPWDSYYYLHGHLKELHLSYIGLDAFSWHTIFFRVSTLRHLQWNYFTAIDFDTAVSALETYIAADKNCESTVSTISGLRYLSIEPRPGTPIDEEDTNRFLTLLMNEHNRCFCPHRLSLRSLILRRFSVTDDQLYHFLLSKLPQLEELDLNLSCDLLTLIPSPSAQNYANCFLRKASFSCGDHITVEGLTYFLDYTKHPITVGDNCYNVCSLIRLSFWHCYELTEIIEGPRSSPDYQEILRIGSYLQYRQYLPNQTTDRFPIEQTTNATSIACLDDIDVTVGNTDADRVDEKIALPDKNVSSSTTTVLESGGGLLLIDDRAWPSSRVFGRESVPVRSRPLTVDEDDDSDNY